MRHGQYELDSDEHGLTELGRKQSERLAQRLSIERLTPKKDRGLGAEGEGDDFLWDIYCTYVFTFKYTFAHNICTYMNIDNKYTYIYINM